MTPFLNLDTMEAPLLKLADRNPGILTGHRQIIAAGPIRQWFLQCNAIDQGPVDGYNQQHIDFIMFLICGELAP